MRIALGIEYDGTDYFGFQAQENLPTIETTLNAAIGSIADHPVSVVCAGRTDRGVHAKEQVIHFETEVQRPDRAWILGVNAHLPRDISVKWAKIVPDDFHARFKATSRTYQYRLYNARVRSALEARYSTWFPIPLDAERMHEGAQAFLGQHDFSAFRSTECQAKTPVKTVEYANIRRENNMIILDIKADAFLHHMVRNIMGTLIILSIEKKDVNWITELLNSKDRTQAGFKAEPQGLTLIEISYPSHYNLPMEY